MTNQEKRERRREAARKAAATRAAKQQDPPQDLDAPTARQLLERAQSIGREADLWYHAHLGRWPTRPSAWTAAQRRAAEAFLAGFIRPDGTPQPVPHRKRRAH